MDDALIGVGAGLLVLLYERRQRQNIIRKLEVIRLMNHHVRNSLQVISFVASIPEQEELRNNLRDAVERIEWALQEVLPGQKENIGELPLHPKQSSQRPGSMTWRKSANAIRDSGKVLRNSVSKCSSHDLPRGHVLS
jgi:hypothetical protein